MDTKGIKTRKIQRRRPVERARERRAGGAMPMTGVQPMMNANPMMQAGAMMGMGPGRGAAGASPRPTGLPGLHPMMRAGAGAGMPGMGGNPMMQAGSAAGMNPMAGAAGMNPLAGASGMPGMGGNAMVGRGLAPAAMGQPGAFPMGQPGAFPMGRPLARPTARLLDPSLFPTPGLALPGQYSAARGMYSASGLSLPGQYSAASGMYPTSNPALPGQYSAASGMYPSSTPALPGQYNSAPGMQSTSNLSRPGQNDASPSTSSFSSVPPPGLNPPNPSSSPFALSHEMGFQRDMIPLAGVQGAASPGTTTSRALTAMATLRAYQAGKRRLEARVVENDRWWRLRHGDGAVGETAPEARSGWLLNSILNKHADAMDNLPQANVLPREEGDRETAKVLSQVLPVILEQNGFDQVWSEAWWQKLQAGASVYGVFWDQAKLNGLGDVAVRSVDLLNLFWEPGVKDIQRSRNLFHVEKQANETLAARYPKLRGKLGGTAIALAQYDRDDPVDEGEYTLVIDWYYKVRRNGRDMVHYCKLCAGEVLYASEDDPQVAEEGFYAHGQYPFVMDVLFPLKDSPAGFGYIDLMKDTQTRIDDLAAGIAKNARMRATKRFFIRQSGSVNEKEFADWSRELVHAEGTLDETSVREITVAPMGTDVMNALNAWINELKETSGTREFSQGGVTGGVTAASAIAALQEAGSKLSRDMLKSSYRVFTQVCQMVLELVRQFYDLPRAFRVTAPGGESYVSFDNTGMLMGAQGQDFGTAAGQRLPVFDILVRPQKSNPYSKVAQNEMALEFYRMGFFNPGMADQALNCLEMMDFDGKDVLMQRISETGGMQKQMQEMQQQMMKMASVIDSQNPGAGLNGQMAAAFAGAQSKSPPKEKGREIDLQTGGLQTVQPAQDIAQRARLRAAQRSDPQR